MGDEGPGNQDGAAGKRRPAGMTVFRGDNSGGILLRQPDAAGIVLDPAIAVLIFMVAILPEIEEGKRPCQRGPQK